MVHYIFENTLRLGLATMSFNQLMKSSYLSGLKDSISSLYDLTMLNILGMDCMSQSQLKSLCYYERQMIANESITVTVDSHY
jgi:hypothetical protein